MNNDNYNTDPLIGTGDSEFKRCPACGVTKLKTSEFWARDRSRPSGLQPYCKACEAAYNAANRDERTARQAAYYIANRDKLNASGSAYRATHPEVSRAKSQRRRARKLSLPVLWTGDDEAQALEYWHNRCAYCDCALSQLKLFSVSGTHFDHYVALSDPRRPHPGTTPRNMIPACAACNLSKHDSDPVEWLTRKLGARKARTIVNRVETYFASLTAQT